MLGSVIPFSLVNQLEQAMQLAVHVWGREQEIALEHLTQDSNLRNNASKASSIVIDAIQKRVSPFFHVPSSWTETTYIRQKKMNEHTDLHQDFDFFQERDYVVRFDEPAYTWWSPISQLSPSTSRLRLFLDDEVVTPKLERGDVVLFHQSIWHDSTLQRSKNCRFSIDGRVFLK